MVPTKRAITCSLSAYVSLDVDEDRFVEEAAAMYHSMVDQVRLDPEILASEFDLAHGAEVWGVPATAKGADLVEMVRALAVLITFLHPEPCPVGAQ